MRRNVFITMSGTFALVLGAWILPQGLSAQRLMPHSAHKKPPGGTQPIYNPYPPGLLPGNLEAELDRVRREIGNIFKETLAEWKATPPPTGTGNPLPPQGTSMRLLQILGKLELYDTTISVNQNVACTSCHMPYTGFTGPISSLNATTVAYPGSVHFRFGKRKPNAYTYSPFYPALDFNETQQDFYGATSGICAPRDGSCKVPMRSRRRARCSIRRNMVSPTPRA